MPLAKGGLARFRQAAITVKVANKFIANTKEAVLIKAPPAPRPAHYGNKHGSAKLRKLSGSALGNRKNSEALARFKRAATTVKVVNQFKAAGEGKLNAAPPIEVSVYVKHGKTAKQRHMAGTVDHIERTGSKSGMFSSCCGTPSQKPKAKKAKAKLAHGRKH